MRVRWGRNKFTLFMRQMLVLTQTGTVEDYITKFDYLRHQILLHDPHTSEVFFVERFIAGLKQEIRVAVVLHRPEDVDTASFLAQLQETEMENDKNLMTQRTSHKSTSKVYSTPDKLKSQARSDDSKKGDTPRWDDKLEALRTYRKSKGLCFTCGDKWSRQHKCPAQVPLHVMEELLEVLQDDDASQDDGSSSEEELLTVQPVLYLSCLESSC